MTLLKEIDRDTVRIEIRKRGFLTWIWVWEAEYQDREDDTDYQYEAGIALTRSGAIKKAQKSINFWAGEPEVLYLEREEAP